MFGVIDELEELTAKVVASEQTVDVAQLRRVIDRLEYVWLRSVRDAERNAEWSADFASTCAWLREQCNVSPGYARASVNLARRLEALPATAEAFAAGEISRPHAEVIGRAATPARIDAVAEVEAPLVEIARKVAPPQLRQVVERVTDALDGGGGAPRANEQFDRRSLHLSRTFDGMVAIDGLLDPEQGERVLAAVGAVVEKNRAPADQRSKRQLRADAFVDLVEVGAAHHATGPESRNPPHVTIVVDLEALEDRGATDLVREIRCETAHGATLSRATLERLTCDAGIARIITQGRSEPLDVGRSTRTISPALRRALIARDRGCVVPGCDRPPGWCEVHHKVPWSRGGSTNLENCELRCWRHHRDAHEGGETPLDKRNAYQA